MRRKIGALGSATAVRGFTLISAVALAASVLLVTSSSPRASASSLAPTVTPVLSQYENASRDVSRDGGFSVALPNGEDLWLFGDTGIFGSNGSGQMALNGFISGSTAAEGPYVAGQVPTSLSEVASPGQPLSLSASNPPALFIPTPTDVYLPDGSGRPCTSAPGQASARWIMGAAVIPNTSDVLITYADVCITGPFSFRGEGWGFAEYNWNTNTLDVAPDDVFPPSPSGAALAPSLELGSPVFNNGQVTLFSYNCTSLFVGCSSGQVYAATLSGTVSALSNSASYSVNRVATDGSSSWQPVGISVASYPDVPLRMIETTAITGSYNVMTASTAAGPWHLETTGLVPGCQELPSGFCYALMGHPELSTSSQLVISYYDPGAGPAGSTGPVGHLVGVGTSYTEPVPSSPQQLSAVASSTGVQLSVQLKWSAPSNGGSGVTYNIYRSTTSGREQSNFAAPVASGVTGTTYTDNGLANGTTYYYVVSATNSLGFEGLASTEASATATTCATSSSHSGYWMVARDGAVFTFGGAPFCGTAGNLRLNQPVVGMAGTSGPGYWLAARDGGVLTFNVPFLGSMGGTHLNQPVVGMAATPSGQGYWLVASDGGIFTFGDAGFRGSTGNLRLNAPIVGMAATPSGQGYWLVASDGGIFTFGDAGFHGSMGAVRLNAPVVGMAATPSGQGYWLVASDGGIFTFGDAGFRGSTGNLRLNAPIVGMAATPGGQGYWLVASDGGIFTFGLAAFQGSLGGQHLNQPVAGMAHD